MYVSWITPLRYVIRSPCALQASLQIFGRRMRTYILCRVRHRIGRIGLLPQPTQKPPDWVAFVLAGVAVRFALFCAARGTECRSAFAARRSASLLARRRASESSPQANILLPTFFLPARSKPLWRFALRVSTTTAHVILSLPNFRACTKARAVGEARSRAVSAQDDAEREV